MWPAGGWGKNFSLYPRRRRRYKITRTFGSPRARYASNTISFGSLDRHLKSEDFRRSPLVINKLLTRDFVEDFVQTRWTAVGGGDRKRKKIEKKKNICRPVLGGNRIGGVPTPLLGVSVFHVVHLHGFKPEVNDRFSTMSRTRLRVPANRVSRVRCHRCTQRARRAPAGYHYRGYAAARWQEVFAEPYLSLSYNRLITTTHTHGYGT